MRAPAYFARFVLDCVSRTDKLVCWSQGGPHKSLTWPEMADQEWRDAALVEIDKSRVDANFREPNEKSDWMFFAVRKGAH